MIINGTEVSQHELSYDKIIKNTLAQSNEMTIRFINGLFGDNIPLTAPVEWLDKESVDNKYSAIVADFYPRIDGKTFENVIVKSGEEVDFVMTTNITETLPWTDYSVVFEKLEAKGRAEGEAKGRIEGRTEGRAERDIEIARALYAQYKPGADYSLLIKTMKDLGISDETIEAVRKQNETI